MLTRLFCGVMLLSLIGVAPTRTSANAKVIGQLGQAVGSSSIYSKMSSRSRTYYRVKAYEYLIIRKSSSSSWYAVVMENGRLGYVSAGKVASLPYMVTTGSVAPPASTAPSSGGSGLKASAGMAGLKYIGTPYKWGGNDLNRGIDCSGFVQQLFGNIGIDLPRTAAEQALVGQKIARAEDLRAGDRLYFWDKKRGKIGHTGIYLGNNYFVHSSSNNRGVATDDLRNPKWRNILVAARR